MNKNTFKDMMEKVKKHTIQFVAVLAIISGIATYVVSTQTSPGPKAEVVLVLLNIDLILFFFFCTMVVLRLVKMVRDRRKKEAGSNLEVKFVSLFGMISMVPTICVAVFSMLFFNIGLQSWFSKQVYTAVNESNFVANAYLNEHKQGIIGDVFYITNYIAQSEDFWKLTEERKNQILSRLAYMRDIDELLIIDPKGYIKVRVGEEAPFSKEEIPDNIEKILRQGEVVMLNDIYRDRVRAIYMFPGLEEMMLMVGRDVDPEILQHIERAEIAIERYKTLEGQSSYFEVTFNLIYLVVALLLLIVAIWFGMTWARQIIEPVKTLIKASERIRRGDLTTSVPGHIGTIDEFNTLAKSFNRMVRELKDQQKTLMMANEELDEQRRQIEYVLSSVSAGVISLDVKGQIKFHNHAAENLLGISQRKLATGHLSKIAPSFWKMIKSGEYRKEVDERKKTFSVTIVKEEEVDKTLGYILTFDDLTALITAQKKAAWGDVAQRIAHEVKNPLTPLQLAAERLQGYKKYLPKNKLDDFKLYTGMITDKVEGVKRMIDIFSKFAKMPAPEKSRMDLADLIHRSIAMARSIYHNVDFSVNTPEKCMVFGDEKQLGQVLFNIIKNAVEASSGKKKIEIKVTLKENKDEVKLVMQDNGPGFENLTHSWDTPYPTQKTGGSGLGLAIISRMIAQHDGKIALANQDGAKVTITLPKKGK